MTKKEHLWFGVTTPSIPLPALCALVSAFEEEQGDVGSVMNIAPAF